MKTLYLFDFDGTLSFKDSTKTFYRNIARSDQYLIFYYLVPFFRLLKYFMSGKGNFELKKSRMRLFLKYCSPSRITGFNSRSDTIIDNILHRKSLELIRNLKSRPGTEIFIVSAGFSFILKKWTDREGISLISNEFESEPDGKLKFNNDYDCNGIGKALRIKSQINLSQYGKIIAIGNSQSDFHMFQLADKFYLNTLEIEDEI